MTVSAIVAVAQGNVIGFNNQIPWYLPVDMQYFKKTTLHHHVIMGRKCYQSIGNPLPKRTNIIITRQAFFAATHCLVAHSVQEALEMAYDNGETEAFIIGGGEIYEQSQHFWDKIYLTKVDLKVKGDVFFPPVSTQQWKLMSEETHRADEKNEYDCVFEVWERKIVELE